METPPDEQRQHNQGNPGDPYARIRDDNLRLIFAEVIAEAQAERLGTILTGLRIVRYCAFAVVVLAAGVLIAFAFDTEDGASLWDSVFSLPGIAAIGGAVAAVLIFVVLRIERRRTETDIREHEEFLKSYNREIDGRP